MSTNQDDDPAMTVIPNEALENLLTRAAERGAQQALDHLGLENGHAAHDIHELRHLLDAWRDAR